jgi:hypothetical protein
MPLAFIGLMGADMEDLSGCRTAESQGWSEDASAVH